MEFAHLVQLFSEKSFQEILNSFDDDELLTADPNFIPILFEVALSSGDKRKCDLLFINSLNHIDTRYRYILWYFVQRFGLCFQPTYAAKTRKNRFTYWQN